MIDISVVPTTELIDELQARTVCSYILLIFPDTPDSTLTKSFAHGNDFTKLGLVTAAVQHMQDSIADKLGPSDGED